MDHLPLSETEGMDEDMLQFKDSARDSVISYLKNPGKLVDTPTRILNNSNDFLPLKSMELALKTGKD